jgi:hypothetical protein
MRLRRARSALVLSLVGGLSLATTLRRTTPPAARASASLRSKTMEATVPRAEQAATRRARRRRHAETACQVSLSLGRPPVACCTSLACAPPTAFDRRDVRRQERGIELHAVCAVGVLGAVCGDHLHKVPIRLIELCRALLAAICACERHYSRRLPPQLHLPVCVRKRVLRQSYLGYEFATISYK